MFAKVRGIVNLSIFRQTIKIVILSQALMKDQRLFSTVRPLSDSMKKECPFLPPIRHAVTAFVLLCVAVLLAGCGKRKAPQPPIEKIRQRVELKARQQGNKILLSWKLPAVSKTAPSLLNVERADIYRLTTPGSDTRPLDEEDFAAESTLISTVKLETADFGKDFVYTDTLSIAGQAVTLHYAVRLVNASGQKAAFSNFVVIQPAPTVALAPEGLSVESTQDAIVLSWNPPERNIDGSKPANIMGFNVYRGDGDGKNMRQMNGSPVTAGRYLDSEFEFDSSYSYFVRSVSLGPDGAPVESENSARVPLKTVDVFPPSAPDSVTIAASTKTVSIFFASNPEKDVAGYKVFRTVDPSLPENEWTLITPKLILTTTFQDDAVEPGKTYYYFIVALDRAGNASSHSAVVSETVPQ